MIKYINKNIKFIKKDNLKSSSNSTFETTSNISFLICFLCVVVFSAVNLSIAVLVFFLFFYLIGFFLTSFGPAVSTRIFSLIFSIAVIFSIIFYYLFQWQYGIPYGGGGSDSLSYEQFASIIANSIPYYDAEEIGTAIDFPYHNSKGYIYTISLLIRFSNLFDGFHTLIPRFFNSFLLALCSVLIFAISQNIFINKQNSLYVALVSGLLPIMIYVSVQSYRDIPILFIILLSVYLSISFLKQKSFLKQIFLLIAFIPLFLIIKELRFLSMLNLGFVLLITMLVKVLKVKIITNRILFLFLFFLFFIYVLISTSEIDFYLKLVDKLESSAIHLSEGVDRAGEGGLSLILFNLPAPLKYIASVLYSFITPLPIIYTRDVDWNFLSIGTIFQFFFIPFVFFGLKNSFRSTLMVPIFSMFLVTYSGYVFGSFTFRHITYFIPFAAIYGVIGYNLYRDKRWKIWIFLTFTSVVLIMTYYIIKI